MSEQSLCNKCGAVLLPEAKFCGKCGAMVQSESPCASAAVVKTEEGAAEKEDDINTKKLPARFETLMKAIWIAIGLGALSSIIGLIDVQEYYWSGRFGYFLYSGGEVALSIWLAVAIVHRQNWARVTFIVLTLFACVMQYKFFSTDGNGFCVFLGVAALAIDLFCVLLLLTSKISRCFIPLKDGVRRAKMFLGVFVVWLVISFGYGLHYQSANEAEFVNNCAEAAAAGSKDAYQTLIDYSEGHEDISKSDVDAFVESKQQGKRNGDLGYAAQHSAKLFGWAAVLGKIKGVGKAVAIVGALLCGIGAWFKKTFIDGGGSK